MNGRGVLGQMMGGCQLAVSERSVPPACVKLSTRRRGSPPSPCDPALDGRAPLRGRHGGAAGMCDLPELAIQKIVSHLAHGSVFQLVALASVSSTWRSVVKNTQVPVLRLESSQELHCRTNFQRDTLAARFHRTALASKTSFFLSAAKLLRRHHAIVCSGQAITDAVVIELVKGGAVSVTIQGSTSVTDSSITAIVLLCPDLRYLRLVSLPSVRGGFLPTLLRKAKSLECLGLSNLPSLNWDFLTLCSSRSEVLPLLRSLTVADAGLETSEQGLFAKFPRLKVLSLGCHAPAVWAATQHCPELEEVVLATDSTLCTDDCLAALLSAPALRVLELCPRSFTLSCSQLRLAGMLNLRELRLESHAFKQQPLNRVSYSHLDNEGIKALVDSICTRCLFQRGKQPFKLSLCGATGITHNAVSALLRLPIISGLLIDGCHRISAIDKMRLVAKVKAGRELLDGSGRRRQQRQELNLLVSCAA